MSGGHLKIVCDEPSKAKPRGRNIRRPSTTLSLAQQQTAKVAIRVLARQRFGSLQKMSAALGFHLDTLCTTLTKRGRVTADIVLRVALKCSIPVEQIITPGPREAVAS